MTTTQTEIIQNLGKCGIRKDEIDFRGNDGSITHFRYRYWRPLTEAEMLSISHIATEEIYDDEDGEDDRGRPITRRLYSYHFTNK